MEIQMRYRRMHYRYAVVLANGQPRPIGEAWRTGRSTVTLAHPCWRPASDIYETRDAVTVTVELAGVDPDDLEVLLYEDALVVAGERRLPSVGPNGRYYAAEIRQGWFRLEVALPTSIDPERAEAHYERGLLQMTLAKSTDASRGENHNGG
jgi:HSP20 family molecular chaperone IbpA